MWFESTVKVRDVKVNYGEGYSLTKKPKKKKRVNIFDPKVMPTGVDDGHGAQRLLTSYVNEAINPKKERLHKKVQWESFTEEFLHNDFLSQVKHQQLQNMPLTSQIATQQALASYQPTKRKQMYIKIYQRLKRNDTHMIHARLSHEAIDDTILKYLSNALLNNKILQVLNLHDNFITDDGIKELCYSLRFHPSLHTLYLGANKITDIGARFLSNLLLKYSISLRELNVSNKWPSKIWSSTTEYDLHPHITYIGAQYFANQLKKYDKCGLISLNLSNQRIRDDGAIALFQILIYSHLHYLNLSNNELSDRSCSILRESLIKPNIQLEEIILSHNLISDEGAIHLAYAFAENCTLRVCDVSYNNIGPEGLDALYLCLQYNQSLISLITIHNQCHTDNRAEELVLKRNKHFDFTNPSHLLLQANMIQQRQQQQYQSSDEIENIDTMNSYDAMDASRQVTLDSTDQLQIIGLPPLPEVRIEHHDDKDDENELLTSSSSLQGRYQFKKKQEHSIDVPGIEMFGRSIHSKSFRNLLEEKKNDNMMNTQKPFTKDDSAKFSFRSSRSNSAQFSDIESDDDTGIHNSSHRSFSFSSSQLSDWQREEQATATTTAAAAAAAAAATTAAATTAATTAAAAAATTASSCNDSSENISSSLEQPAINVRPQTPPAPMLQRRASLKKTGSIGRGNELRDSFMGGIGNKKKRSNLLSCSTAEDIETVKELRQKNHYIYDGAQRKSKDLGHTIGIPYIKNIGIKSVRSDISSYSDSGQHLIYLRVSTPYDTPYDRPYSLIQIGKDHQKYHQKICDSRQTEQYKADKDFIIKNTPKRILHEAARPKVPNYFWEDWNKKIRLQYLHGIDNTSGCTSIRLEPLSSPSSKIKHQQQQQQQHHQQHHQQQQQQHHTSSQEMNSMKDNVIEEKKEEKNLQEKIRRKSSLFDVADVISTTIVASKDEEKVINMKKNQSQKDVAMKESIKIARKAALESIEAEERTNRQSKEKQHAANIFKSGTKPSTKAIVESKVNETTMEMKVNESNTVSGAVDESDSTGVSNAYELYAIDPSQAFRRHLNFKGRKVTPGQILAARRKENRLQKMKQESNDEGNITAHTNTHTITK